MARAAVLRVAVYEPDEVLGTVLGLKADHVGPEEPLQDPLPPGELGEEFDRRKRDVEEEADPEIGPHPAEHRGHQLEVVILHEHARPWGSLAGSRFGEALIDRHVGPPPVPVKLRLLTGVVVERPESAVGETLVVVPNLIGRECDRHVEEPLMPEGS